GPTPIEGVTGDTPVTDVEIQPGTYTLTESGGPAGYEQQNLTCTDGEQDLDVQNGVVEISANQDVTCTFTNAQIPDEQETAELSLAKEVSTGEAAPTDWTLSADGPTPIEGVTGDTPVTDVEIQPGTYTLTESGGPAGYEQQNLTCTDGEQDLDVQNGVVEISANQDVTCTFTNALEASGGTTPSGTSGAGTGGMTPSGPSGVSNSGTSPSGSNGQTANSVGSLPVTGVNLPVHAALAAVIALFLVGGAAIRAGYRRSGTDVTR
ncbi:MAG: hypothetical protein ACK5MR_18710, partial [Cumulibacter sp.]